MIFQNAGEKLKLPSRRRPPPTDRETNLREHYLIWSNEHGAWWRPNAAGYTIQLEKAGRYSRSEALKHCAGRDQEPGKPLPELPIKEDDLVSVLIPLRVNG